MNKIKDRINSLKSILAEAEIDAFIIPSSDAHQSEYVAEFANVRQWISGFTGSAGTVIITKDHAGLWTDSRYYLQAETELEGTSMEMHKMGNKGQGAWIEWLNQTFVGGGIVAFDGNLFTKKHADLIEKRLNNKIELNTSFDPIDHVWIDRPPMPLDEIYEHELKYAIISRAEKLNGLRQKFLPKADKYVISALDDIAWLFNLRGKDIDFNPIFYAFALITKEEAILFCNPAKIPQSIQENLLKDGVEIKDYDLFIPFVNNLNHDNKVFMDLSDTSISLYRSVNAQIVEGTNIVRSMKGVKSAGELSHVQNAMEKDGVALLRMYMWLENELDSKTITEAEVSDKIQYFRSLMPGYVGESFPPIVGYEANGAIIHYRPHPETSADIHKDGMLLIDSGGQYLDGTTDITRTIHFGVPTPEQKTAYTSVLKGKIAIDQLVFPEGTIGYQMDILARAALWKQGLDYGHGTGHGVGYLLNVHEGPQGISQVLNQKSKHPMQAGMITSNEPGFYKTGAFGIRIENLIVAKKQNETDYGSFLAFETLTLFPIATNLIDMSLLTRNEVDWLNNYHAMVEKRISPHLNDNEQLWLKKACKAI
jgi:Xaa-Pro aminopeptidase